MKVKAIHWTARKSKDGTAQVMIYVYAQGKKKYYGTGIKVLPKNWSASKQKVIGLPQYMKDSYNTVIERKKIEYLQKLSEDVPADQMEDKIHEKGGSALSFLNLYIQELETGLHNISPSTVVTYRSVRTRLNEYLKDRGLKDLSFAEVNLDWYRDYYAWVKDKDYGIHSFDKAIKILKKILRIAHERGLHDNLIYQHSEFRRFKETGDQIYLTEAEIQQIETVELTGMEHLARERDRFLISYYFIMRWEDSTRINKEAIIDHQGLNYGYTSQKTHVKCIVPVSSRAQAILERRNYDLGNDTNQKANDKIKEVAMLAGITQVMEQNGVKAPKYKFITTHTARRSAATNLYLQGVDLETIARLGGWKKLETLKTYLKASGLEVAQNAKKFDFFK